MVYLDGDAKGKAPTTVSGLSPGTMKMRVVLDGYKTEEKDIEIGSGKEVQASFILVRLGLPEKPATGAEDYLQKGKVTRGWLGIMIQDITPELADSFGIKQTKGVLVGDLVQDGPADKAGLKRGDIITNFNGKGLDSAHTLSRLVAATSQNTAATLQILRDGKNKEIKATIGTMPEEGTEVAATPKESAWGLTVQNLTPDLRQRFGWDESEGAVVISDIKPDSPAGEAKLRGDLVKEVNRQKTQNVRDYNQALQKIKKSESLLLLIKRGKNTFYVALKGTP